MIGAMSLAYSGCKGPDGDLPGPYRSLKVPERTLASPEARERGRALYLQHCALCHGDRADGRGVRRQGLNSPPRDFTDPAWRRRTSPAPRLLRDPRRHARHRHAVLEEPRRIRRLGPDRVPARRRGETVTERAGASRFEESSRAWGSGPGSIGSHANRESPAASTTAPRVSRSRPSAPDEALEGFVESLRTSPPPAARIRDLAWTCDSAGARSGLRDRREPRARETARLDPRRPRDLLRLPGRDLRPRQSALPVSVHQLHQLRPPLHDRPRRALRPSRDDDGAVSHVRRLPARVRLAARPPLPRPAQRLPGLRAAPEGS